MFEKGCHRRVCDESPVEVAGVAEELQLIAVKAVAIVGGQMKKRNRRCDGKQEDVVRARLSARCIGRGVRRYCRFS